VTTPARPHYLQTPQIAIIYLAFLLLSVPLAYLQVGGGVDPQVARWLTLGYVIIFGNTHFAVTWALYLNHANLEYFASSPGRKAVYFLGPPAILVTFWYLGIRQQPTPGTVAFIVFTLALTAIDYFHAVRQSFGVYVMFRARTGARYAPWMTSVDNWYFLALWALQVVTFARGVLSGVPGRFDAADPLTRIGVAGSAVLLAFILSQQAQVWRAGADRGAVLASLGYLALQSASALMVVWDARLFVASLAMHYVEYQVLMAPRVFRTPLDTTSRADRIAHFFRRHKTVFYMSVLLVATWASAAALFTQSGAPVTPTGPQFWWYLVNLLNGIFLAHYFIEAFVWKFGNPFYRQALAPVYFGAPAGATPVTPRASR
jgi:hypothetical protein